MDLTKILEGVENSEDIIKQIEAEVGRNFVPRSEFNEKNTSVKSLEKQLADLTATYDGLNQEKANHDKVVAELTEKMTAYERTAMRSKVAYELGLPFELAGRLAGDTEDAIREDAGKIAALIGKQNLPPLKSTEPIVDGKDAAYKQMLNKLKGE